jgi:hypothetical protein
MLTNNRHTTFANNSSALANYSCVSLECVVGGVARVRDSNWQIAVVSALSVYTIYIIYTCDKSLSRLRSDLFVINS